VAQVAPARPFLPQPAISGQGKEAEAAHADGHPRPELPPRTAKGGGPDHAGQAETEEQAEDGATDAESDSE